MDIQSVVAIMVLVEMEKFVLMESVKQSKLSKS